ncbi:ribonuclease T2 family protein [Whalleya microplaca]|nr:ribonuclease T2 family protein [Whalleya microplaca]
MHRAFALSLLSQRVLARLYPGLSSDNHTCALVPPVLSCSEEAQPGLVDSCCVETFGGLVLQTQFWNTYTGLEAEGQLLPKDSWTIHGLWPDFCNGSYTQYCDLSRQYDPEPSPNTTNGKPDGTPVEPWTGGSIEPFLEAAGRWDLIAYMKKYWLGFLQPSSTLWAHEYSKHATCFSTFATSCYSSHSHSHSPSHSHPQPTAHADMIDFFSTTISHYQRLPTWSWLSASGIRPSNDTTYSLSAIQDALRAGYGRLPYVGCAGPRWNATPAGAGSGDDGFTVLGEVWYYQHVYGRVQSGWGRRVDADVAGGSSSVSNCAGAEGAVRYLERAAGSVA